MEESYKHYLSQLVKVNVNNNSEDNDTFITMVCLPKAHDKSQLGDILKKVRDQFTYSLMNIKKKEINKKRYDHYYLKV